MSFQTTGPQENTRSAKENTVETRVLPRTITDYLQVDIRHKETQAEFKPLKHICSYCFLILIRFR